MIDYEQVYLALAKEVTGKAAFKNMKDMPQDGVHQNYIRTGRRPV